jgi:hypothetical protein
MLPNEYKVSRVVRSIVNLLNEMNYRERCAVFDQIRALGYGSYALLIDIDDVELIHKLFVANGCAYRELTQRLHPILFEFNAAKGSRVRLPEGPGCEVLTKEE